MFFLKKTLYIVGIPIGNIFDFSQRAIFILKNVDVIITEDTRKTGFLLKFLNLKKKLISINSYNEKELSFFLISSIKKGLSIALVSDSGTPLISDPGFFFIYLAYKNDIRIMPIPGTSSVSTLLSISPFNINKFIFEGFLPKNKRCKKKVLEQFINEKRTIIFFESSKRLLNSLILMKNLFFYKRRVFIAKDLTKKFESILFFELQYLYKIFNNCSDSIFYKGEFALLLEGVKEKNCFLNFLKNEIKEILNRECFLKIILFSFKLNKNLFYKFFF